MGEIVLTFDLNDEEELARAALDGHRWKQAMVKLDQELRNTTKYTSSQLLAPNEPASELEQKLAERYRELIREILNAHGLQL